MPLHLLLSLGKKTDTFKERASLVAPTPRQSWMPVASLGRAFLLQDGVALSPSMARNSKMLENIYWRKSASVHTVTSSLVRPFSQARRCRHLVVNVEMAGNP
ncbi:hypothetical protein H8959_019404 [Pygathrix nigripes]